MVITVTVIVSVIIILLTILLAGVFVKIISPLFGNKSIQNFIAIRIFMYSIKLCGSAIIEKTGENKNINSASLLMLNWFKFCILLRINSDVSIIL